MDSNKQFAATRLRNRLLNAAYQRGVQAKRGFELPFAATEVRSCKVALKAIMRGHFKLAFAALNYCADMQAAVFE